MVVAHERQGLALGLEAGDHLGGVHAQFDDLERHLPPYRLVLLGEVNDPHAAFAELAKDAVRADFLWQWSLHGAGLWF